MPKIICFEGIDGVGKDTIIDRLIKVYPDLFFTFRFPTPVFRSLIKMWVNEMEDNNIDHVIAKNSLFLADFLNYQEFLKKARVFRKCLLLNRYWLSSLAYARCDFDTLTNDIEVWEQLRTTKYHPFINTLAQPDLTILLNGDFMPNLKEKPDTGYTKDQLYEINRNYTEELTLYNVYREKEGLKQIDTIAVPALSEYTYDNVITLLKGQGVFK